MIYVYIENNTVKMSTNNKDTAKKVFTNYITTDFEDYNPSNNKYKYNVETNSIILNPNYEKEQAEEEKQFQKSELQAKISELDLKSIRAIREGGTMPDGTTYADYYTAQISELRKQIAEL